MQTEVKPADCPVSTVIAGTPPLLIAPFRINICEVLSQREKSTQRNLSQHSECLLGPDTGLRKPRRHSSCP